MNVNFIGELRGIEQKTSKKGEKYHVYRFEDIENSEPFNIMCKNLSLVQQVKKGDILSCKAKLKIGTYTSFELIDIEEKELE